MDFAERAHHHRGDVIIHHSLNSHRAIRVPGRRKLIRAAVAVVIRNAEAGPSVLLVRRAQRQGDPWSGDMAFPGGRLDAGDPGGCAAACRETLEETGLQLTEADRIGRLHDRITRAHRQPLPMVVSPFVFTFPNNPDEWRLNHEVDKVVWVPLAFLEERGNRNKMRWNLGPIKLRLPCYDYQQNRIWGLTLLMLDELIRSTRAS